MNDTNDTNGTNGTNETGLLSGLLFDIQRGSFVDGPGIRTTVFFKGCSLRCRWCHNPESQKTALHLVTDKSRCTGCGLCKKVCPHSGAEKDCTFCGRCASFCPSEARKLYGRRYTVRQVMDEVLPDREFYEQSHGGVTFSGGECMLQSAFLVSLLRACRDAGIHTAVDTAGAVPFRTFEEVMPYTDLFLYDVKCRSAALHRQGTGVGNEEILENLTRLSREFPGEIIVRVPVIGGFNDTPDEMAAVAAFLAPLRIEQTELLPYHTMGKKKYEMLGYPFEPFTVPDAAQMKSFRRLFER